MAFSRFRFRFFRRFFPSISDFFEKKKKKNSEKNKNSVLFAEFFRFLFWPY